MCGEQTYFSRPFGQGKGSPPRVRGTVGLRASIAKLKRITPACAGNSFSPDDTQVGIEDHPRVCGEQNLQTLTIMT